MDEGGCDASDADQSLSMAKELIETYRMHPRISGCAAPHATNTLQSADSEKSLGT